MWKKLFIQNKKNLMILKFIDQIQNQFIQKYLFLSLSSVQRYELQKNYSKKLFKSEFKS
ncbi:hypothetical protein pb186bvf_013030 [Paramecium bursaria]